MKRKDPRKKSAPTHPPKPLRDVVAPKSPHADGSPEPSEKTTFPVVGIGASAGGLEAFSQLLRELPADTGMAFVLVQHLDPSHESQLPEVLSRTTTMAVIAIMDRQRVEPDHVYVIPANANIAIVGGIFTLTARAVVDRHTPIDHFFRSLAEEQEGRAIGVVLSGTGSDGTLGLRAIKAEGGITFVQDAKSAKYPSMPQSAAAVADFVLPPAAIARELARIGGHPSSHAGASPASPGQPDDGADVGPVLRALRTATGVDFAQYKPASIRRRITRRMLLHKIDDIAGYVRFLRETPGEAQVLHDDILIQVTEFFRDREGFDALKKTVFPSLVKERPADEPIRIWVPGCATGEEAYSLVICLLEFLGETDHTLPIQMFATDLSAAAITRARAGTYPASIEKEVSPERLRKFFVRTDGRYQVSKAIRDVCVFAPQDVTRDPPFSKLDLISCCNVLIYLRAVLQERVIPILHYALKSTGFLKLGPSESVGRFTDLFSVVDRTHKIYARRAVPSGHLGFGFTAGDRIAGPARAEDQEPGGSAAAIEKEADRLILGRYAPAGVVVNADMQIVQFRGKTGPYLEAPPGAASFDLFKMAREGLASALRQALQQVAKRGGPVKTEGLRVKTNGGLLEVSLEVIPIGPAEGAKGRHHLILFFEERARGAPAAPAPKSAARPKTAGERRVLQLIQELADTRQHLQAISEEHEAGMEELRAATEEAQSSNEELQSTNEELETSKEELQATNEELTTVNDELSNRNVELGAIGNDISNLLTSTHVPIIMVGADLRVRRMTPVTERTLNLAPSDIGRPIGDLRLSVDVADLDSLIREVGETLMTQEREVQARDDRWYSMRVRPYRTADNTIDGTVISFVDIDVLKRGLDQARTIVETVREPLVVLDADLHLVTANRSFYETFQVRREEAERQSLLDLGNRQWDIPQLRAMLEGALAEGKVFEGVEVEQDFERIGTRTMLLNARRMPSAIDQPALILLAIEDLTERMRAERERSDLLVRRAEAVAATQAKDEFLAVLSHELRTPLTSVLGWTRMLRTQTLDEATAARGLQVIERNAVLQVRLIEDLLDMSRIVLGTMRVETLPVMVAPAVHATLAAVQPLAEGKGVVLNSALDDDAGPVRGDPARLQQIVWNLVSNAIKFTPSGGRVDVRVARLASAVEISVRDTGRGIVAEQLPKIFSRFGIARTSTQSQGGMGLGLSIVRHLVELHGGTVRAESPGFGQGAAFTVNLPLTEDRAARETEVSVIAPKRESGQHPALDGVRVLVVDDEADARELLRAILAQCGADVTVAATARAALEALERVPFDVLVSDIVMPDEDGYDLIRNVRARGAERGGQIPALALTAYALIEDRTAAIAAGYQQHAAKPIDPGEVAAAVAALVGRSESNRRD